MEQSGSSAERRALTPGEAYGHIRESIAEYLETQYRISHRAVFGREG